MSNTSGSLRYSPVPLAPLSRKRRCVAISASWPGAVSLPGLGGFFGVESAATFSDERSRVNPSRRYLLISPCRDEAQYLRHTLDSVAGQSVRPALWVVVDDGSTDDTPAILEEYARRLPHPRVLRRTDRGRREVGPGVVE